MYSVTIDHQLTRCLEIPEIEFLMSSHRDAWLNQKSFRIQSGEVFFKVGDGSLVYSLDSEIHQWLIDRDIHYTLSLDLKDRSQPTRIWLVGFENRDDALMFKLTWGGS